MDNKQLMKWAQEQMTGGWLMAAVVALIVNAIISLCGFTYILSLLVCGPLTYGFFLYLNNQVDYRRQDINLLFAAFSSRFLDTMVAGLLISLAVGIGMICLIVPGIILALGFSMTFLIMIDNPNISGVDAMKASWQMMQGHKTDLFCLWCRFIGWLLLCLITAGVLLLWIQPYMWTALIGFYRQLRVRA